MQSMTETMGSWCRSQLRSALLSHYYSSAHACWRAGHGGVCLAKTTLSPQPLVFVLHLNVPAMNDMLTREQLLGIVQAIVVLMAISHGLGKMPEDLAKSAAVMAEKARIPTPCNAFLSL